jgi:hypothetical protein
VIDAELVDQGQILINTFDAEGAGLVDRGKPHRPSIDEHLPRIRLVIAGQDLEQSRFAGAVVAKDAERLAMPDPHRHAGKRGDGAENLDQVFGPDRRGRGVHSALRRRRRAR